MKQYHLPDFLPYGWDTLSFGTDLKQIEKHANLLNRQVLFSPIFNSFYKIPNLISFKLEVKATQHEMIHNDNEFEPTISEPIFQFNITKIKLKNDDILTDDITNTLLNSIKSFDQYIDGIAQEKVLLWIWKRGKELNLVATRKKEEHLTYIFEITKELSDQLCQDAYKENYTDYYNSIINSI